MTTLTYYYRKADDADGEVCRHLQELGQELGYTLIDICVDDNPDLRDRLNEETSTLQIGPYRLRFPFSDVDIRVAVTAFKDRQGGLLEEDEQKKANRREKAVKISGMEKFSYWLSNNYVWFLSGILAIFVGLPLLAPVLMKNNHKGSAQVIYSVYSVFCHQLAFRSFFFYGEQLVYPRELANVQNVITYEEATGKSAMDITYARAFQGNEQLGYKVAICERDVAIYLALLLGALLFQLTGRKLKSIPWYWWVILAIIPIGLDGGTQLFSLGGNWPAWFPIRESTPLMRVITGGLFGFVTALYIFPMMEESMLDIRTNLARKLALKRKLIQNEKSS